MNLAVQAYEVTKKFPREEQYGFTSQIRRCSVSIAANIAEGHGRETSGLFVQFLRTAQGSLKELETHIILSGRVELLDEKVKEDILCQCEEIGKMLRALIRSIQSKQASAI